MNLTHSFFGVNRFNLTKTENDKTVAAPVLYEPLINPLFFRRSADGTTHLTLSLIVDI